MSIPQTGATVIIFCVCGTYILVTIVLLVKFLLQYCHNRNKPVADVETTYNHWRQNNADTSAYDNQSFIYGVRPNRLPPQRLPLGLPIEHPPAFNEALSCPSPLKVSFIQVDQDELPSYSDYEQFYATKRTSIETESEISSDNPDTALTNFHTGKT